MKMLKRLLFILLVTQLMGCTTAEIQSAIDSVLSEGTELTSAEIGSGLKQALEIGIGKGSDRLSQTDGYFKSAYKILLPEDARKVTDKLQNVPGFSEIENVILEKINRGAEDAAKKAKPIFVDAIKQMTFNDALNILMGENNAATNYLDQATHDKLYQEFNPVIVESLDKFNARKYWSDAVNTYNSIPFIGQKVNSDLDDYITGEALKGLFDMVAKEELNIRKNVNARSTDLLQRVFAKQDNK